MFLKTKNGITNMFHILYEKKEYLQILKVNSSVLLYHKCHFNVSVNQGGLGRFI